RGCSTAEFAVDPTRPKAPYKRTHRPMNYKESVRQQQGGRVAGRFLAWRQNSRMTSCSPESVMRLFLPFSCPSLSYAVFMLMKRFIKPVAALWASSSWMPMADCDSRLRTVRTTYPSLIFRTFDFLK